MSYFDLFSKVKLALNENKFKLYCKSCDEMVEIEGKGKNIKCKKCGKNINKQLKGEDANAQESKVQENIPEEEKQPNDKNAIEHKLIRHEIDPNVPEDEDGHVISICGDWIMHNSTDAETPEAASYGYSDGEEPDNAVHSVNDFIGISFHLIQQTGGSLTYKDKEVSATKMSQTGGGPAQPNWIVKVNGKKIKLGMLDSSLKQVEENEFSHEETLESKIVERQGKFSWYTKEELKKRIQELDKQAQTEDNENKRAEIYWKIEQMEKQLKESKLYEFSLLPEDEQIIAKVLAKYFQYSLKPGTDIVSYFQKVAKEIMLEVENKEIEETEPKEESIEDSNKGEDYSVESQNSD